MKIVIAGLGGTGESIVRLLVEEKHSVTVIDKDPQLVQRMKERSGVHGAAGNAARAGTLSQADVKHADLYIAATGQDELNIVSCVNAKRLGAKHTLAISHAYDFIDDMAGMSEATGIDGMFNPDFETAAQLMRWLRMPAATKVIGFAGGRAELAKFNIDENSQMDGRTLAELRTSTKLSVLVCAVQRDGQVIIPDGRFEIKNADSVYITGPHDDLCAFLSVMGMQNTKPKDVMIIGASKITGYLARMLEKSGISVKIIEKDALRCGELSKLLDKTKIVCAEPFDGAMLAKEGVSNADVVFALAATDEENAISAMYAKKQGAKKIIANIARPMLCGLLPDMGVNSGIISGDKTLTHIILSYVRSLAESTSSEVSSVSRIADGEAEITEFIVKQGFKGKDVPLMRLDLKPGILIAGIIRENKLLYPNGMTFITENDRVLVITAGKSLKSLNEILG